MVPCQCSPLLFTELEAKVTDCVQARPCWPRLLLGRLGCPSTQQQALSSQRCLWALVPPECEICLTKLAPMPPASSSLMSSMAWASSEASALWEMMVRQTYLHVFNVQSGFVTDVRESVCCPGTCDCCISNPLLTAVAVCCETMLHLWTSGVCYVANVALKQCHAQCHQCSCD